MLLRILSGGEHHEDGEISPAHKIELAIHILEIFEIAIIAACSLDIFFSIVAFGSRYFSHLLNIMDFTIITLCWVFFFMNEVKFARIFMLIRLFKVIHIGILFEK